MPLVSMKSMLKNAADGRYAVGYFESWNLESLLAVKDAAEESRSPVIIGFNGGFLENPKRSVPENIVHYGTLGKAVAEQSPVPMALILNEGENVARLLDGARAGFNAISFEAGDRPFEESERINTELAAAAHGLNVEVEAEAGHLPDGRNREGSSGGTLTDPARAAHFVERTGVDALAVSVGNVHVLENKTAGLDLQLLQEIVKRVEVPLVLHGGTSIDPGDLREAIAMGVTKINIGTVLRRRFIDAIKKYLKNHDVDRIDPGEVTSTGGRLDMLNLARIAVKEEVSRLMDLFGCSGKA